MEFYNKIMSSVLHKEFVSPYMTDALSTHMQSFCSILKMVECVHNYCKASFPLIAKASSQASASALNHSDWMKVLAASLRVVFCVEWKRALK